jgi:hypothetical protein
VGYSGVLRHSTAVVIQGRERLGRNSTGRTKPERTLFHIVLMIGATIALCSCGDVLTQSALPATSGPVATDNSLVRSIGFSFEKADDTDYAISLAKKTLFVAQSATLLISPDRRSLYINGHNAAAVVAMSAIREIRSGPKRMLPIMMPAPCGGGGSCPVGSTGCDPNQQNCGTCIACDGPFTASDGSVWCMDGTENCGQNGDGSAIVGSIILRVPDPGGSIVCNYDFTSTTLSCRTSIFFPRLPPNPPKDITVSYTYNSATQSTRAEMRQPGISILRYRHREDARYQREKYRRLPVFPNTATTWDMKTGWATYTSMYAAYNTYGHPFYRDAFCAGSN